MAYSLTYSYNSTSQSYSVTKGVDITTSDKVVIPDKYNDGTNGEHPVTSIGSSAFSGCSSLTSVTIGNSVTSIGGGAFNSCSSLTSITIPDSVTFIGGSAFNSCSLTSVTIPDSVTTIGDLAFRFCSSLTSVTIGNSVTSIGESVFEGCSSLTSVTIGNSVTSIDNYAFGGCSGLTSVTIPDSVTSIGNYAFAYCSSLIQLILFPLTPPTLVSGAIPATVQSIYVKQSSKAAYQAATNWTTFASKIVGDNLYLSFIRFNQKNKEYIDGKISEFKVSVPTRSQVDLLF